MTTTYKNAVAFEDRVRKFLKSMGFENVNGGPKFKLGGRQVDAVGGYKDILLVIECKHSDEMQNKTLLSEIDVFRGKLATLRRGIKNQSPYTKYNKIVFLVVTKNISWRIEDKNRIKEAPKIFGWTAENDLTYYEELQKTIGKYAMYNLLGELEVSTLDSEPIRVPAFKTRISGKVVYSFMMKPEDLLKVSYVARREIGNEQYYQRIVDKTRIEAISDYIDDDKGFFPNNIIIAIKDKGRFTPVNVSGHPEIAEGDMPDWVQFGVLQFPKSFRSCWIIDGQHRLYSFTKANKSQPLSVFAFDNLNLSEQTKFFIEINDNQKPVNPDLIWDLHGEMRATKEEGIISNAIKGLNSSDPFIRRIYVPLQGKKQNGMMKLSAFCNAVKRADLAKDVKVGLNKSKKNPIHSDNHEKTTKNLNKALQKYFMSLSLELSDGQKDFFLFSNGGISILIYLYKKLLNRYSAIPTEEQLRQFSKTFRDVLDSNDSNYDHYKAQLNSEGGRSNLTNELTIEISNRLNDEDLLATAGKHPLHEEFVKLERSLSKFFVKFWSKIENWEKDKLVEHTYNLVKSRSKKPKAGDSREELHEYLTYGEIKETLEKNWKELEKVFINQTGFASRNSFFGTIDEIIARRNPRMHSDIKMSQVDQTVLLAQMKKIHSCIDSFKNKHT